jgi:putative flippase GtrA
MSKNGKNAVTSAWLHTVLEFTYFLALGGLAAAVNLLVRFGLNFVMPFELAVVLAYICGMVVAFLLFGKLLFEAGSGTLHKKIIRFTQVNILGAGLAWIVSVGMARVVLPQIGWAWHPLEIAHLVGVATPAISSYFLHKHYTFA